MRENLFSNTAKNIFSVMEAEFLNIFKAEADRFFRSKGCQITVADESDELSLESDQS